MTDLTPGDLVEIHVVGDKKAYAQITHSHHSYPPVVRVIKGLYDTRPADLDSLVSGKTSFVAMIPLASAMTRAGATVEKLGSYQVPLEHRDFPTFRTPIRDKKGEIVYWWFWDGRGLTYDVELTEAQSALPMREVMTGARFLELLAQ